MTEPDAFKWERYYCGKSDSRTVVTVNRPEKLAEIMVEEGEYEEISEIEKVPESEKALYSKSTIKALLQEKIEELGKDISYFTYREKDVETREAVKALRDVLRELEQ